MRIGQMLDGIDVIKISQPHDSRRIPTDAIHHVYPRITTAPLEISFGAGNAIAIPGAVRHEARLCHWIINSRGI